MLKGMSLADRISLESLVVAAGEVFSNTLPRERKPKDARRECARDLTEAIDLIESTLSAAALEVELLAPERPGES